MFTKHREQKVTVPCGDSPLDFLDAPAKAVALQSSAEDGEARHAGDAGEKALARMAAAAAAAGGARGEAVEGLLPAAPTAPRRIVQHTSTVARAQPLCSRCSARPAGGKRERGAPSPSHPNAREPYRGARELSDAAAHRTEYMCGVFV